MTVLDLGCPPMMLDLAASYGCQCPLFPRLKTIQFSPKIIDIFEGADDMEGLTQPEAKAACRQRGARLVEVELFIIVFLFGMLGFLLFN